MGNTVQHLMSNSTEAKFDDLLRPPSNPNSRRSSGKRDERTPHWLLNGQTPPSFLLQAKVMLVFQNDTDRQLQLLCKAVDKAGLTASVVTSQADAEQTFQSLLPEIVIIDHRRPVIANGREQFTPHDLCRSLSSIRGSDGTVFLALISKRFFNLDAPFLPSLQQAGFARFLVESKNVNQLMNELLVVRDNDVMHRVRARIISALVSALDHVTDAVHIANGSYVIQYVNPSCEKLYGYSSEELVGKDVRDLQNAERNPKDLIQIIDTRLQQGKTWEGSYYTRRKSGSSLQHHCCIVPVLNSKLHHIVSVRHISADGVPGPSDSPDVKRRTSRDSSGSDNPRDAIGLMSRRVSVWAQHHSSLPHIGVVEPPISKAMNYIQTAILSAQGTSNAPTILPTLEKALEALRSAEIYTPHIQTGRLRDDDTVTGDLVGGLMTVNPTQNRNTRHHGTVSMCGTPTPAVIEENVPDSSVVVGLPRPSAHDPRSRSYSYSVRCGQNASLVDFAVAARFNYVSRLAQAQAQAANQQLQSIESTEKDTVNMTPESISSPGAQAEPPPFQPSSSSPLADAPCNFGDKKTSLTSQDIRVSSTGPGGQPSVSPDQVLFQMSLPDVPEPIAQLLADYDKWQFEVLKLEELTNRRPLLYLGMHIMRKFDAFSLLDCTEETMYNWLHCIELNYRETNPYHNSTHAADVLQCMAYLFQRDSLRGVMDQTDQVGGLIAAIIHDVDHPGRTNPFLVNSANTLALLYNDRAVLESHHCALAFKLTSQDSRVNIFRNLGNDEYREIRENVIDMVLATEMSKHFEHVNKFATSIVKPLLELKNSTLIEETETENGDHITTCVTSELTTGMPGHLDLTTSDMRSLIKRILIKVSDINNPSRPRHICIEWANRISEEYLAQTDEEKERNLPVVMPSFDRKTFKLAKTQVGFIDFFLIGMFDSVDAFIEIPEPIDNLQSNYDYWKKLVDEEPAANG